MADSILDLFEVALIRADMHAADAAADSKWQAWLDMDRSNDAPGVEEGIWEWMEAVNRKNDLKHRLMRVAHKKLA